MSTPLPICKFTVPLNALKALSLLASKDQRRFILTGASVERKGDHKLIVATDGRRLGVIQCAIAEDDQFDERSPIIPTDLIKRAPKPIGGDEVQVSSDGRQITISNHIDSVTGPGIEGAFPKWTQVMPQNGTHPPLRMAFNGELMKSYFDIAKVLKGGGIIIEQAAYPGKKSTDQTPFCIRINGAPEFFGVLMPIREDAIDNLVPDWVLDKKEA